MDIRRTVLWMIFSLSLLMLWNNWQIHTGQPSFFGGPPASTQVADAGTAQNGQPAGQATDTTVPAGVAAQAEGGTVPASASGAAPAPSELVTITTDVYKLTFDTLGAQLIGAELLKYKASDTDDQPMVLLQKNP